MQECNGCDKEFKNPFLRAVFKSPQWLIFWGAAALLLFVNLGLGSIHGSEGRWLTVSKEMLATGDFLHPTLYGNLYFDKPLVSYWFIVAASVFSGDVIDEFIARLPGVICAMFGLWGVILLARKFWNDKVALTAAWVMLTIYSFAYYGRMAEADTENMVFTLMAVVWYIYNRDKKSFWAYVLFWAICGVGANLKGLGAVVIPVAVVGIDVIVRKCIFKHLNWKFLCAAVIGVGVYLFPFILTAAADNATGYEGLYQVLRENIVRFVEPYDHKDPFWAYFVYLPQLFLPWTPFLVLALIWAVMRFKKSTRDEKWLIASIILIFTIFSASGSRRVYYIMPILPFCALLVGAYLNSDQTKKWMSVLNRVLISVYDWALRIAPYFLFLVPVVFYFFPVQEIKDSIMESMFCWIAVYGLAPAAGLIFVAYQFISLKRQKEGKLFLIAEMYPAFTRVMANTWFILFLVLAVLLPSIYRDSAFRTLRPFAETMHEAIFLKHHIPAERVCYYGSRVIDFNYYLDVPGGNPVSIDYGLDYSEPGVPELVISRLNEFIDKLPEQGGAIIMRQEDFDDLPEDIQKKLSSGIHYLYMEQPTVFQRDLLERDETGLSGKKLEKLQKEKYKILKKKYIAIVFPVGKSGI